MKNVTKAALTIGLMAAASSAPAQQQSQAQQQALQGTQ